MDAIVLAEEHLAGAAPQPWDRLPDETEDHYVWFMVYLNSGFGSARSIRGALRAWMQRAHNRMDVGPESPVSDSRWREVAGKNRWKTRAFEYDVYMLSREGAQAVLSWVSLLRLTAQRTLVEVMNNPDMRPRTFGQLMQFLQVFGEFIPQETVAALQDSAANDRTPGIGA